MSELLTVAEATALAENERVIERGIQTFTEVGNALLRIRDGRLYRAEFSTFEDYCRERWGFSDSRARQLIGAAQTVTTVTVDGLPAPTSERQARELARVPEPERAEVWRETVERTGGRPTAAAIRETYRRDPGPEPEPEPQGPERGDKRPEPGIWYGGPAEPQRPKRSLMDALEERMPGSKAEVRASHIRARLSKAAAGCADIVLIPTSDARDALTADEIDTAAWQVERAAEWIAALKKARSGLRVVGGAE